MPQNCVAVLLTKAPSKRQLFSTRLTYFFEAPTKPALVASPSTVEVMRTLERQRLIETILGLLESDPFKM